MFINVASELKKARESGYAIGAFNTSNLEVTKAICRAAKELDSPVIIQTTPGAIEYAGLEQIFNIVKTEIETTGIPAAIHLDHAKDFETVKKCIDIGYRSVMIDGSKLPFEENVALTSKVVEYAHPKNVSVEAEIGVIGADEGSDEQEGGDKFSTPEQTKKFIELTGVDSIAVSIGNEHGAPEGEKLNLDLLKSISELIDIPLVLHGASGLSEEDIKSAISLGITKINIDTQIRQSFLKSIRENIENVTGDYRELFKPAMEEVGKVVEEKIKLFSNENK
jgi:fructose-bisphosphate aldolase class II